MLDGFRAPQGCYRLALLRGMFANAAFAGFLFAWPFVTLYVMAAWFLMDEAAAVKGNGAERLYFLGALMLYLYPLLLWLKIKISFAAVGMAAFSVRPLPILVAAVTWLALKGLLPTGVVGLDGRQNLKEAVLYSAVTILATLLFRMGKSAARISHATHRHNAPALRLPHLTQENSNDLDRPNSCEP
ncbi:MAG TPA: hypothetical protein VKC56_05075 [Gallionellaceae bacterium]|nr:hypothetical protein [Gallionellaceae bacterium]